MKEFVILLSNTPKKNANIALERVREIVEHARPFGRNKKITISVGLTKVQNRDKIESVLRRADKALYLAKSSGRNIIKYI